MAVEDGVADEGADGGVHPAGRGADAHARQVEEGARRLGHVRVNLVHWVVSGQHPARGEISSGDDKPSQA